MIPLINLKRQFTTIEKEIVTAVNDVIQSGNYILGPRVSELEKKAAQRLGTADAITLGNGTDALALTLEAFGIGSGDEVITSPFTFFATAEAISRAGAVPVFADVTPDFFTIDPEEVAKKITSRTKAILPVHLFGQPADMDEINAIAKEHDLIVIEDACQAFGAFYKGMPVGSLADAGCFSFFPTKNLGTLGDGGMVTTSDEQIAAKIRKLRAHGSEQKYYHDMIGYNSRLDEIHAAILLICLQHIEDWNNQRKKLANHYNDAFSDLKTLLPPRTKPDRTHIYHLYCLKTENRDQAVDFLQERRISTGIYYPCCLHLQSAYKDLGYKHGDFPVAEQLSDQLFAIPMHPFLGEDEQQIIISAVKEMDEER
ncbi:DegT/DnrJ/EryC1/StrS family aminotransferase [Virgibacillus senegalensis]|uniref:DegT/DnrJ/EryC1/StrS family aminotransferase n=1 Tax=Virgibacillus senegalensis TaxID=1499679 RepID=UPI00069E152B|nr:DegT/DnrJ/EryC1/StrS family aminotransferase [Virgibacillus senegalensis]